jgi:transposase
VRQLIIDLGFSEQLNTRRSQTTISKTSPLTSGTLSWIAATLRCTPRVKGFDADRWTNERLRIAIEKRIGVRYSRMYVWKIATDPGLSHLPQQIKEMNGAITDRGKFVTFVG